MGIKDIVCCDVMGTTLTESLLCPYTEIPDVINIKPISNRTSYGNAHIWRKTGHICAAGSDKDLHAWA